MLVLSPGVYGMNSNTHIALCDIQMFAHIPNLIYLAPATKEEYEQMFKYATTQRIIRLVFVFPQVLFLVESKMKQIILYLKIKLKSKEKNSQSLRLDVC